MTYLRFTLVSAVLALGTHAAQAELSCEQGCFEAKRSCTNKTEMFLGHKECNDEQVACTLGCNSGKPMKNYRDLGALHYSFRPVADKFFKG